MSKIEEIEHITAQVDGEPVSYTLKIESYDRNTRLMANVSYGGKNKGLSLTLPISDGTAFQTFRILSSSVFNELYNECKKEEEQYLLKNSPKPTLEERVYELYPHLRKEKEKE
jgi:hypothetical protein